MFEGFYDGRPAKRDDSDNRRLELTKDPIKKPGNCIYSVFTLSQTERSIVVVTAS